MPKLEILHRAEFPGAHHVTAVVRIEVAPGEFIPRHTHPGLEIGYLLEGEAILMVDGRPDQVLRPDGWFEVPAEPPHTVRNGPGPARALSTYVVEKDRPLVSWV